jgi:tetratricopeptide (TPR) repeat protein
VTSLETGPAAAPAPGSSALAALEEQRDFLLRSLDDLEQERAAGDVDEHDYQALKDDYTARAAAVIRTLERRRAPEPASPAPRRWAGTVAWTVGVVVFAVLAGVFVAQAAGRRDAGQTATGDIRQTVGSRLNEAGRLLGESEFDDAIAVYDDVLADQPTNAEALTYRAWALRLSGERSDGLTGLLDAATVAPDYPDVHALLAVVFFQEGLVDLAAQELELLEDLDPPPHIQELVAPLAERIADALANEDDESGGGG